MLPWLHGFHRRVYLPALLHVMATPGVSLRGRVDKQTVDKSHTSEAAAWLAWQMQIPWLRRFDNRLASISLSPL